MADNGPGELADELEREVGELESRSEQLHDQTEEVRKDWERKRNDAGVPGATPRETGGAEPEAQCPSKADSLKDGDER